jgi:hypothetical protein
LKLCRPINGLEISAEIISKKIKIEEYPEDKLGTKRVKRDEQHRAFTFRMLILAI